MPSLTAPPQEQEEYQPRPPQQEEDYQARTPQPRAAGKWVEWVTVLALILSLVSVGLSGAVLWTVWPRTEPEVETDPEPEIVLPQPGEYITYRDRQLPILEGVPVNAYDSDAFSVDERGWLTYQKDGVSAISGVDVSAYQREIDWTQVAKSGIRFAMIRVGYRGYGESGAMLYDNYYQQNIEGALAAGLEVGVYFFSQATSVWEAEEEAELLLQAIEGYEITYPVVFDWEFITGNRKSRTSEMTGSSITRMAAAFCDMVAQAGYQPGIYFNQDTAYLHLDLEKLVEYPFWLAEYNAKPRFYYGFDMWQYSDKGTVPGIEGKVDLNLAFWDFNQSGRENAEP